MQDFIAYAQFEGFWERFQPETPFGRTVKEEMTVICDAETLEGVWDRTEAALAFLAELELDQARFSRVTHHLKRLPRFPEDPRPLYDEVEIFQFKKFLHNYKSLVHLLSVDVSRIFGFSYASESFEQLLDMGRQSSESFYVADAYSSDLARIRAEIWETDAAIQALQERRVSEIRARWGIDFGGRAFVLVAREMLAEPEEAGTLLLIEPFDETKYAIRPVRCAEELLLQERRAALLSRERSSEEDVLEMISHAARGELGRLKDYREAITRFDLAFAGARLARQYRLLRPQLSAGPIQIEGGRFVPCEELCCEVRTEYVPLDATFDFRATVIFGSNMGGKTIVLKTLAFLQLCAQTGLFVPAVAFHTRVFRHFHYLGEGRTKRTVQGLSGFGFEIRELVGAWADFDAPTLALFDEFARTTNSLEAEAILSAVMEAMTGKASVMGFFSTHFRGVQRLPGICYLRMKGLDRRGIELGRKAGAALEDCIRLIDQHMEYHLVPDDEATAVADAIAVAGLLGLDPAVSQRADDFFNQGH